VVPTGKYRSLGERPLPVMYFPWPRMYDSEMTVHVRGAGTSAPLGPLLRREVEAIDASLPLYDVKTLEDHLAFALLPARLGAIVLGVLGALGLILLMVGINGVVALSVARRTRELGIRVAVGGEPSGVGLRALWEEVRVLGVGLLLGVGGGMGAGWLVRSVLYSGSGFDPVVMVGVPLVLMAATMVAAYGPARRAVGMDPTEALRAE
jgi:ABC-type antimicrobial peptide transport system permease subunit